MGNVYALDLEQRGDQLPGFPLSVGHSIEASPLIYENHLSVVTESGILRDYAIADVKRILWSEKHGDGENTNFRSISSQIREEESLLSSSETYNWPNPIRDGSTFFRCLTSESSEVSITVVDAAGSLIDSIRFTTSQGVPYETLWQTDAASGVYYARVKAISNSGRTDSHLIKLAIIR